MKHYQKLLTAFVFFTLADVSVMAQDSTQGKVNYVITMNLHASLKPDQQQYKDVIPEFMDREVIYLFKGRHGLLKSIEGEKESEEGGVTVKIKMGSEDGVKYVDMDTKKDLQLVDLGGKQYLYSGTVPQPEEGNALRVDFQGKEEETGERKKILGYDCKKVILKNGKDKSTYWYTTVLPILGGAMGVMSGKGLVLELESAALSFKAKSVQFEKIADAEVLPPKGVKTIDEKEYAGLKGK